ncbi:hypothetical protein [Solibacillus sp. FSL H8-0538]|uniref:hypothetical protein n=1 Tax=Solibacillus sp. FSL H8-0538 TaxID=2921400 RepID=UPI0030FC9931
MVEVSDFLVLETDRLVLRQVTTDDAKSILAYLEYHKKKKSIITDFTAFHNNFIC